MIKDGETIRVTYKARDGKLVFSTIRPLALVHNAMDDLYYVVTIQRGSILSLRLDRIRRYEISEEKITIEKYCSGLDIAPTLANLFGLPYDSRLYAGSDILSDQEGLVIFDNKSFITDRVAYNAVTGTATPLNGATVTEEYLEGKKREVKQKFAMSKGILVNDYFSYLPK